MDRFDSWLLWTILGGQQFLEQLFILVSRNRGIGIIRKEDRFKEQLPHALPMKLGYKGSVRRRRRCREMEEKYLDMVMVPLGLLLQATYHIWLFFTIVRHPNRTVIGVNAQVKHRWLRAMMTDPLGNGTLAVQTLRNDIMASTALATTAVTLASLISVFVSATTSTATSSLVYGNKSSVVRSIKYFALLLCFILAFLCNVQSVRYHTHAGFLMSQPVAGPVSPEHAARSLDRGSLFWSLGLRAFYVSFTLFLWVFGPIPMLASSVVMCCLLFFLDTTTELPRAFHVSSFTVEEDVKEEV
ncbi:unnamed protein product [Musa acuminata var. zebrina]